LTLEALRARGLRTAGVVLVGNPDPDNRAAIEEHGGVAALGELPHLVPLTGGALAAHAAALDPAGLLAGWVS
jgi:hypothetical protein